MWPSMTPSAKNFTALVLKNVVLCFAFSATAAVTCGATSPWFGMIWSDPRMRTVISPACASSSKAFTVLDPGNSTASCESVIPTGLAISCS